MTSFGGHKLGDSVRRMLSKLGTNKLFSLYSLKGVRGKRQFIDLPVTKALTSTCDIIQDLSALYI